MNQQQIRFYSALLACSLGFGMIGGVLGWMLHGHAATDSLLSTPTPVITSPLPTPPATAVLDESFYLPVTLRSYSPASEPTPVTTPGITPCYAPRG